jgi:ribosomal protein L40E
MTWAILIPKILTLQNARNAMRCRKCGNYLEPDTAFCPSCGQITGTAQSGFPPGQSVATGSLVCERCAGQYPVDALKCPRCGVWRKDIQRDLVISRYTSYPAIGLGCFNLYLAYDRLLKLQAGLETGALDKWIIGLLFVCTLLFLLNLPYWIRTSRKIGSWWWW